MKHQITIRLPFHGSWFTVWGGDSKELNYHAGSNDQTEHYALDLLVINGQGKPFSEDSGENTDYYAFGKAIISPAEGTVVEAVDGVRDNEPGVTNPSVPSGNYVLIKHASEEFSKLTHLKNGTLTVNAGDKVQTGEKVGECGNSGGTSQPHLHFQLQDSDVFARFNKAYENGLQQIAQGIKVYFSNIEVETDDGKETKSLHSPVKGEIVKNAD